MTFRLLNPSSNPSELFSKRIEQLSDFAANGHSLPILRDPGWKSLAEALFCRAPLDFLRRTSTPIMGAIVHNSSNCLDRFSREKSPILVEAQQYEDSEEKVTSTGIHVVVTDRPFIVDSITECLRSSGIEPISMLHPIVSLGGAALSLTFVEIDRVEDTQRLKQIEQAIRAVLQDVILVTDDYAAMKETAANAATRVMTRGNPEADSASAELTSPAEISTFLSWLVDHGFVFLGSEVFTVKNAQLLPLEENRGLFRSTNPEVQQGLAIVADDAKSFAASESPIEISSLRYKSKIHRGHFLDLILVKVPSAPQEMIALVGMLTSKARAQEAASVPIVRRKLKQLLVKEELLPNSHAYKEYIAFLNHIPKTELLGSSVAEISKTIALMRGIHAHSPASVSVRSAAHRRFTALTIAMPRERFASTALEQLRETIETILKAEPGSTAFAVSLIEEQTAAIFALVPNFNAIDPLQLATTLEDEINDVLLTWDDHLQEALVKRFKKVKAQRLYESYRKVISDDYKASVSPEQVVLDIENFEKLSETNLLLVDWRSCNVTLTDGHSHSEPCHELRIYRRGAPLALSTIVPVLEDAGLDILNENVTTLHSAGESSILLYVLSVKPRRALLEEPTSEGSPFLSGLAEVLLGRAESDELNALLLNPKLSLKQIALVRTYAHYLFQIKAAPSPSVLHQALISYPQQTALLTEYFETKFDPSFSGEREFVLRRLEQRYLEGLKAVTSITDDKILHTMLKAMQCTLRTNYYVHPESFRISVKISPRGIHGVPRPVPFMEIFVHSPEVSGVHLRFGKVARGGLRWSERPDDFRTEVLGLVKTQQVKNTIIVPVGAKGGFIVRNKRQKITNEDVVYAYKLFIRSLLEISDNRVGGSVVHRDNVICYDEFDPYFVVAADKGTAAFSDIANEIAEKEFNFWLGDAFASGGTYGYSHKKYGITARGAWEAVCVLFREIGVDVEHTTYTAVGIGDMSGDVFGNGMILNKNLRLVAAFDHRHIFIDPTPDAASSFIERKRLFDLPRSSWMDYDRSKLSAGGGVYSREDKAITLTPEVKAALGIEAEQLSGTDLIKAILRAPVDLLWNGGIGTYVKASTQEHSHAADRTNDDVRVDASELRCKIVGEGGNLGFTQLARIEFARLGGKINTDAIDNSGGVDLSDHEVNLKILFSTAIEQGLITRKQRDEILLRNVNAVCDSVLVRNRAQSTALGLIVKRSPKHLAHIGAFFSRLEKAGTLDRRGEVLPDLEEIQRRLDEHAGLTRPEAAVLLAYSKMALYQQLLDSLVPDDPYLEQFLLSYFPSEIAEKFREQILVHPLRREIICTQLANLLAERTGPVFIFRIANETGVGELQVIRAAVATYEILGAEATIQQLESTETARNIGSVHHALLRLRSAMFEMTRWLSQEWREEWTIGSVISRYREPIQTLFNKIRDISPKEERNRLMILARDLEENLFSTELTNKVASFGYAQPLLEIADLSLQRQIGLVDAASFYFSIGDRLHMTRLLETASSFVPHDQWEATARRTVLAQIRGSLQRLSYQVLNHYGNDAQAVESFFDRRREMLLRYDQWLEEFSNNPPTLGAIVVVADMLQALCSVRT